MTMTRTRTLLASTAVHMALAALPAAALVMMTASEAAAQAEPIPPENYTLDSRGVDLVTGGLVYSATDLVIGTPGQGGIAHGRVWVNGGWAETLTGTILVSGSTHVVSLGGVSEVFTKSGSTFTPASNRGATLTQVNGLLTFTASDGTIAEYSTAYSGSTIRFAANNAALMKVTRPNGEILTYHWDGVTYCRQYELIDYPEGEEHPPLECIQYRNAVRLDAVRNNRGYQINFRYASDDAPEGLAAAESDWFRRTGAIGFNMGVDYCDPNSSACTGSRTWPEVQYASSGDFGSSITTVTDQSGRTTTYSYGLDGLTGVRLPGSSADDLTISYASGRVSGVTDASGAWTYSYSDSGSTRTTTASGPLNQTMTAVSDQTTGRATSVTQATASGASRTWTYGYDSQRRLQTITNPEGDYAQVTYDARGNVTQSRSVAKSGSSLSDIVTSAVYPSSCSNVVTCNQPTSTTDARGYTTDYTYDSSHGGLLSVTSPAPSSGAARPQTRITYAAQTAYYKNHLGSIVAMPTSVTLPVQVSSCATGSSCIGTADEVRTTGTYGSSGVANNLNPTVVSQGSGANPSMAVTTMTYTPDGDVATVDGPLSGSDDTTRFLYDNARQNVGVIGPDPDGGGSLANRAQRMTYSTRGQVTLSETGTTAGQSDSAWSGFSPIVRTAVTYDSLGRPLETRAQSGAGVTIGVQQVSYDAAGRVSCSATRMNPATFSSLPSSACTAATTGSDGPDRITQMAYDYAGRPTHVTSAAGLTEAITQVTAYTANGKTGSLTDGNGNVSVIVYDGHDRAVRLRYPDPNAAGMTSTSDYEEVGYDDAGNVVSRRNRAAQMTYVTYDNLNRPTLIDAPATDAVLGISNTMDVALTYDNLGRVLTSTGNGQTLTNVWDPLSRLTSESGLLGAMSYQHDAAGRMTRITWPDTFYAQYDYDTSGAITAIRENGASSGAGALATYTYNSLGQPSAIARGNGIGTSYGYDSFGRMSSLAHGGSANVTFGFGYNAAGQMSSRTISNAAYVLAPGARHDQLQQRRSKPRDGRRGHERQL